MDIMLTCWSWFSYLNTTQHAKNIRQCLQFQCFAEVIGESDYLSIYRLIDQSIDRSIYLPTYLLNTAHMRKINRIVQYCCIWKRNGRKNLFFYVSGPLLLDLHTPLNKFLNPYDVVLQKFCFRKNALQSYSHENKEISYIETFSVKNVVNLSDVYVGHTNFASLVMPVAKHR